ncbi:MAG: DUF4358 domain-containing protein [Solobacterium sp.]|nr:DUF4358 domain-containing protein [Solobacterium sp.]
MLKKFVISMTAALVVLTGCSGGSKGDETKELSIKDTAAKLVSELSLSDTVSEIQERTMYGYFFDMDKETVTEGSVYLNSDGKSDTVGVFRTTDVEKCKNYLNTYIETIKKQSEVYSPEEVFKISHALVQDYGKDIVVILICNDIEAARTTADKILK